LPEGQDFVTAEEFVELDGESEVFSELSAEEIVALVQSHRMDKAESDEDEEDDHKACEITIARAVPCAEQLENFAFAGPEFFCAEQMLALVNMRRELQRKQVAGRRQTDLRAIVGAMYPVSVLSILSSHSRRRVATRRRTRVEPALLRSPGCSAHRWPE
jgi:hypothetical protein